MKGHIQTKEDELVRRCILDIACKGRLHHDLLNMVMDDSMHDSLQKMVSDGLIAISNDGLKVTSLGTMFTRNICSVFDIRMRRQYQSKRTIFSQAI